MLNLQFSIYFQFLISVHIDCIKLIIILYSIFDRKNMKNYLSWKNNSEQKSLKSKKAVFLSYAAIKNKITDDYKHKYTVQIDEIDKKINKSKSKIDFPLEHRKLLNKILQSSKNKENVYRFGTVAEEQNQCENNHEYHQIFLEQLFNPKYGRTFQCQKDNPNKDSYREQEKLKKQKFQDQYKNVQSLNEYLEDDISDEGDKDQNKHKYEVYLKFRKKALLRELESGQNSKKENGEDQIMYRDLFKHKNNYSAPSLPKCSKKFQNAKESLKSSLNLQLLKNVQQSQELARNRAKLNEHYRPIINALSHTNIVKWRVLNNIQQSQI